MSQCGRERESWKGKLETFYQTRYSVSSRTQQGNREMRAAQSDHGNNTSREDGGGKEEERMGTTIRRADAMRMLRDN